MSFSWNLSRPLVLNSPPELSRERTEKRRGAERREERIEEAKETDTRTYSVRTESGSMEESKGPNPNPRRRESDRSREGGPSSREAERGRNADSGQRESDVRTDRSRERDPSSREATRENATQRRHELAQSSLRDCWDYLRYGRCDAGRSCRYNHPPRNQMINVMVPVMIHGMMQTSPYPVLPQVPGRGQMIHPMVLTSPYPVLPQVPERTQIRHETVQTSPYPVRSSVQDCGHYIRTGVCRYGSRCRYNHPPVRPRKRSGTNCKYFPSGDCKRGSDCMFVHPMDSPPMRQARERDPRERLQDASVVAGNKRMRIEQGGEGNIARQRIEGEEIVQEHIGRQAQNNTQRQNTERSPRREIEESVEERRMKEQEQEQADMESQVREAEEKAQEQQRRDTEREKQQVQAQQQQESPQPPQQQHQSLASQFDLLPLVKKLADEVETGTRDTNFDALVAELSSEFNKSLQLLNSISGSLGSTNMTVSGEKRKLEESEKLLQQRRDATVEYKKSMEDILKREP